MDAIASLREGIGVSHWTLEQCLEGVTPEQAHWQPQGLAHSVAASYAHLALSEDGIVHGMLQGKAPLSATAWAKTGISVPPPDPTKLEADWGQWAKTVKVDLPALRQYAQDVYAATDAYLASLKPEDLDRKIEAMAMGQQSLNYVISTILVAHPHEHAGEIAAVKGLQGLKGYPF